MNKPKQDAFFSTENCGRCGKALKVRTMSWFTTEAICMECHDKEAEVKQRLQAAGKNPDDYEGCGYIPEVE